MTRSRGREVTSGRVVATALLVLAAILFLARDPGRLTGPFGDSHDGRNGAEWALASRSLREEGPIQSRFGARLEDGTTYAHHPPLIVLEIAIAETIFGEHPWSTRLPAILSSLASMALLFALLRAWGASPIVTSIAIVVATATPMFLVYGSMLDTPVTSFPLALGVLLLWQRQRDRRTTSPIVTIVVSTLACLAGWEATLLIGVVTVAVAVDGLRSRAEVGWRAALRPALPFAAGLLFGMALDAGWVVQSGEVGQLRSQLQTRSTGSSYGVMAENQRAWLSDVFGVMLFALVACLALLRDRRVRPLAAIALGVPLLYSIGFRDGAAHHDYWNFWLVLAVAVGLAFGFERTLDAARTSDRRRALSAGAAVIAMIVVGGFLVTHSVAQELLDSGRRAGELTDTTRLPNDQRDVATVGIVSPPATWIEYGTGRTSRGLVSLADLRALAAAHPTDLVLVSTWCDDAQDAGLCRAVAPTMTDFAHRTYQFVPAAELERRATHA